MKVAHCLMTLAYRPDLTVPTYKNFCLKIKRLKYFLCICLSASAFLRAVSSCVRPETRVYLILCWLICFRFPTDMLMHLSEIMSLCILVKIAALSYFYEFVSYVSV